MVPLTIFFLFCFKFRLIAKNLMFNMKYEAIFIKHLREKLKLREYIGTELLLLQRTLQFVEACGRLQIQILYKAA